MKARRLGWEKPDRLDHTNDYNTDTPGAWANHVQEGHVFHNSREALEWRDEQRRQNFLNFLGNLWDGFLSIFDTSGGSSRGFATGGVLTTPTVGLMAEYPGASYNPEIVTPQNIMRETIADANSLLADVIAQATQQVVQAINEQNLTVSIGDDIIANSASRGNQSYYNRTGAYLL